MVPPKPTPFVSTFHKTYLAAEDCDLTHPALATKPVQVSAASDFADLQAWLLISAKKSFVIHIEAFQIRLFIAILIKLLGSGQRIRSGFVNEFSILYEIGMTLKVLKGSVYDLTWNAGNIFWYLDQLGGVYFTFVVFVGDYQEKTARFATPLTLDRDWKSIQVTFHDFLVL